MAASTPCTLDQVGPEIQRRVRRQIFDHHAGELLVGVADIVETGHEAIPFLIAAPSFAPFTAHKTGSPRRRD
jgi:hypothetical protein